MFSVSYSLKLHVFPFSSDLVELQISLLAEVSHDEATSASRELQVESLSGKLV